MRFLFLGDIVGAPGVAFVRRAVPRLRASEQLDFVIANAENATNGSGLSPKDYRHLKSAGIDAFTLGDHIYKKFEIAEILNNPAEPICKPANYPATAPGRDHVLFTIQNTTIALISLMGRTYMRSVDCPFAAVDRVLATIGQQARIVIVDMHAEATADKYQMVHHLSGRVSTVVGTHTHVQTADEQILPAGTAFICDLGMSGPYESILGRRIDRVLHTTITFEPSAFDVASGDVRLAGVIVDVNNETGQATAIRRVMVYERDYPAT